MNVIVTPACPLCSEPPTYVLDSGKQAFCFTLTCKIITWNATMTFDEMMQDVGWVDLSGWIQ